MIIAERKPFTEIKAMLALYKKILIVGCGTCVAFCLAGGEKEVGLLTSQLKLALGWKTSTWKSGRSLWSANAM
jgi:hypothetical protein